jgi:acyl-CoA thioester hydrolase
LSRLYVERKGIRYLFYQEIVKPTGECCVKAVVETVFTRNGYPTRGEEFAPYYERLISQK